MQPVVKKLKKPKARVRKIWNYHEMEHWLEQKYERKFDDYAAYKNGIRSTSEHNVHHQIAWENAYDPRIAEWRKNPVPNYGMNQEGMDFYKTPEGMRFWNQVREAYRNDPNGEAKELPFWCWWHFMLDCFPEISNGCTRDANWVEIMGCAKEDWQKEIAGFFLKEFGDKDMEIEFSW